MFNMESEAQHNFHHFMPSLSSSWKTRSLAPSFIDAQATLLAQLDLNDRGDVMTQQRWKRLLALEQNTQQTNEEAQSSLSPVVQSLSTSRSSGVSTSNVKDRISDHEHPESASEGTPSKRRRESYHHHRRSPSVSMIDLPELNMRDVSTERRSTPPPDGYSTFTFGARRKVRSSLLQDMPVPPVNRPFTKTTKAVLIRSGFQPSGFQPSGSPPAPHGMRNLNIDAEIELEVMRCRRRLGLAPSSPSPQKGAEPSPNHQVDHAAHTPKRAARSNKSCPPSIDMRPHRHHSRTRASIDLPISRTLLCSGSTPQLGHHDATEDAISAQQRRHSYHLTSLPSMSAVLQSGATPKFRKRERPALRRHETSSSTQSILGLTLGHDVDPLPSGTSCQITTSSQSQESDSHHGQHLEASPNIFDGKNGSEHTVAQDSPSGSSLISSSSREIPESFESSTDHFDGSCDGSYPYHDPELNEDHVDSSLCQEHHPGILERLKRETFGFKPIKRALSRQKSAV
ncbi:hypothetical protein IAT40_007019 [Kwoniella sp. CBS 6097]